MRFAFWALLFLNAALFAYGQGYVGNGKANEHEPARLKRQFNTPKLIVLTGDQASAAASAAPAPSAPGDDAAAEAPAAATAPAPDTAPEAVATAASAALACLDIGTLSANDARRFEARLAALDLGERILSGRKTVQGQDISSWMVNIPPQGSKEAADRKAAELRELGVSNFFIMNADSPMKYAISLGVFKNEGAAQTLIAQLAKQGVHSARITPRGAQATRYTYRLRALDDKTRRRIVGYAERYEGAEAKSCS